jgi:hypothetical protein
MKNTCNKINSLLNTPIQRQHYASLARFENSRSEKVKPPFYEKVRLDGLSKWALLHNYNPMLNALHVKMFPLNNRLKPAIYF